MLYISVAIKASLLKFSMVSVHKNSISKVLIQNFLFHRVLGEVKVLLQNFLFHRVLGKGPVPLERIAVAITSDYEIPAFLGIRR